METHGTRGRPREAPLPAFRLRSPAASPGAGRPGRPSNGTDGVAVRTRIARPRVPGVRRSRAFVGRSSAAGPRARGMCAVLNILILNVKSEIRDNFYPTGTAFSTAWSRFGGRVVGFHPATALARGLWERGRPARTGAEPPEMRMRAGRPRSQDALRRGVLGENPYSAHAAGASRHCRIGKARVASKGPGRTRTVLRRARGSCARRRLPAGPPGDPPPRKTFALATLAKSMDSVEDRPGRVERSTELHGAVAAPFEVKRERSVGEAGAEREPAARQREEDRREAEHRGAAGGGPILGTARPGGRRRPTPECGTEVRRRRPAAWRSGQGARVPRTRRFQDAPFPRTRRPGVEIRPTSRSSSR